MVVYICYVKPGRSKSNGQNKLFWLHLHGLISPVFIQHVDVFVYEMGLQEPDLTKRAKIDCLRLSPEEWERVGKFADLLSVGLVFISHRLMITHRSCSTLMLHSKHSHQIKARLFTLQYPLSRLCTNPGIPVREGRSMWDLRPHWTQLQQNLISIMTRLLILLPILCPCVRQYPISTINN